MNLCGIQRPLRNQSSSSKIISASGTLWNWYGKAERKIQMGTNQILHHHPTRRFWSQPENPSKTHTQTHLQIISETLKYAVLNATPEIQTTANHTVKLWCLRRRDNYQKQFHITNNLKLLEKTQETTPGVRSQKKDWKKDFIQGHKCMATRESSFSGFICES